MEIRTHCCPYCGLKIDRDYNASLNIKQRDVDSLLPREWREFTHVEIEPLPVANNESNRQAWSGKQEATEHVQ